MPIESGIFAPDFELSDENGIPHRLSSYRGKPVILYFYPKDDTPGCTTEACSFRDAYTDYKKAGVVILGISPDSSKSHKKFIEKFSLPFPLLADEGHVICELYAVWGRKKFMGKEYDGVFRTTILVDPNGMVRKVFENVKPDGHALEVLAELL
jgi:thioredoxin-dependent peroxiredoxin